MTSGFRTSHNHIYSFGLWKARFTEHLRNKVLKISKYVPKGIYYCNLIEGNILTITGNLDVYVTLIPRKDTTEFHTRAIFIP